MCNSGSHERRLIGVVAGVIVSVIVIFLFGWFLTGNPFAGTPSRIAKRIRKTGTVYEIQIKSMSETWNPEKPITPGQGISGPGRAKYFLDESSVVHLTFCPKVGPERHYLGPLPEALLPGSPKASRARNLVRLVVGGYLLLIVAGFMVGYLIAHGSAGHGWIGGDIGIGISMILGWVLGLVVLNVGSSDLATSTLWWVGAVREMSAFEREAARYSGSRVSSRPWETESTHRSKSCNCLAVVGHIDACRPPGNNHGIVLSL